MFLFFEAWTWKNGTIQRISVIPWPENQPVICQCLIVCSLDWQVHNKTPFCKRKVTKCFMTRKHCLQNRQNHYHKKVFITWHTWARCATIFGLNFPQIVLNMINIVILLTSNMITLLTLYTFAFISTQLFLPYVTSTITYSGLKTQKCLLWK